MKQLAIPNKLAVAIVAVAAFAVGVASTSWAMRLGPSPDPGTRKIRADITALKQALYAYTANNAGRCPHSFDVLIAQDMNGNRHLNQTSLPHDPWNRAYHHVPGSPPNVMTLERDGAPGGAGEDGDIDCAVIARLR